MRRAAWIFLAAILLPCLVLAWLAVRSEQDQQVILQHQQAIIDQGVADSLAQNVRTQMDGVIATFVQTTSQMLAAADSPDDLALGFNYKIREAWPLAQVGFAVDLQGTLYAPARSDGLPAQTFRKENESFLSNREDAEVYSNAQNQLENLVSNVQENALVARAVDESVSSGGSAVPVDPASDKSAPPPKAAISITAAPASALAELSLPSDNKTSASSAELTSPTSAEVDQLQSLSEKHRRQMTAREASERNEDSISDIPNVSSSARPDSQFTNRSAVGTTTTATPLVTSAAGAEPSAAPAAALAGDLQVEPIASTSQPAPIQDQAAAAGALSSPAAAFFPQRPAQIARVQRQVAPQENTRAPDAALSSVVPAQSDFRQLIGQSTSGSVARFLEDKLCLLVWSLPAHDSIIFGAQLDQDRLVDKLRALVQPEANRSSLDSSFGGRADYCLALLDDKGQPVALSQPGFTTDWKHPFVATEIGGVLPHWEAALYLTDPGKVSHSARVLHFTIGLIILLLIVAILAGGSLIGTDLGRQMRLAQQKTDFVSNVSHELKTPLTSIRMFADMLAEGRVEDPEKQSTYLRIISAESARLTRLINNVLDFARLERGAPVGERHPCDLVEAAREVVETCQPHLESAGITLDFEVEASSLPLMGDRDALSQIILNLISNAEKYGGGEIVVRARRQDTATGAMGCIDVLDRGPGIPSKLVESVFGSGLGLTLARRMAKGHGGNVTYQPRADGGSCFTLALPLSTRKS
jgi:signal transduction histidine kinase